MRLRLVVIGLAIGVSVPLLVWKSGGPQRFAVERIVHDVLGAHAKATVVGISPALLIERLSIFHDAESLESGAAFAELEGVRVEYSLFSGDERRVSLVHIDTLRMYPDGTNPDETNFQFLLDFFAEERPDEPDTWIPERIEIDSIELAGGWEDGDGSIEGLQLEVDYRDAEDIDALLKGRALTGTFDGRLLEADFDVLKLDDGKCEILARIRGDEIEIELSHDFPDEYRVDVKVVITGGEGSRVIEARDARIGVYSDIWRPLLEEFMGDIEVAFDAADLQMPELHWDSETGGLPTGDVRGYVRGLSVHDRSSLLYEGDVDWAGSMRGGEEPDSEIRVGLSQGLDFNAHFASKETEKSLTVEFAWWEKSAMLRAIPTDLHSGLEDLPFDQLHGKGDLKWGDSSFVFEGGMQSVSKEDVDAIDVTVVLKGEFDNIAETVGEIKAHVGEGDIWAVGSRDSDDVYAAQVAFENVQLRLFFLLATGNQLPEMFAGYIDGIIDAEHPADSRDIRFTPRLAFSEIRYGDVEIGTINFDGELALDTESRRGAIRNILIEAEDETLRFEMAEAELDLDSGDLHGDFVYSGDIRLATRLMELEGFYGTATGTGSLDIVDGRYAIPFTFESGDIEYNDDILPYETVLAADGTFYRDKETSEWTAEKIVAHVGDGTFFGVERAVLNEAGTRAETWFRSDLKLGIEMGYFENIEAQVDGHADWNWPTEGEMTAEWDTSASVESLVLKEGAGTVSNLTVSARGDYEGEVHGEGVIEIENVTAAGAKIDSLRGLIGFAEDVMIVSEARADVSNGELVSRLEMRIFEEGMPLAYLGRLENIDLLLLSEEVQPPKTKLTGIANGTVSAEYSLTAGLTDFDLDVACDTSFSINRSLVEEMMQMQDVLSGFAAKKAEKTIAKFLGKADQRPFDTAWLNVYLLDDVILGTTEMRSEKTKEYNGLNLTIQLNIDKPALVASLKLLEESNIANVSF
ncbi:MAG: hypothetical protein VCB26_02940 [Candidatus Hydrogenedentota bacterium]